MVVYLTSRILTIPFCVLAANEQMSFDHRIYFILALGTMFSIDRACVLIRCSMQSLVTTDSMYSGGSGQWKIIQLISGVIIGLYK